MARARVLAQEKARRDRRKFERVAVGQLAKPFAGVDGEGANLPTGEPDETTHQYMMIRAGDHVLETGRPLASMECLGFLADLPKTRTYIAFFFDYDVSMILRDLPLDRLNRLIHRELREYGHWGVFPIDYRGFQIEWLPGKEFKVRRTTPKEVANNPWTIISDVGPFFQTSFVKALETWNIGTADEMAAIKSGKSDRGNFIGMTDEIRYYNDLECQLLVKLMQEFAEVCAEVGYLPKKWQGPGNLAVAMFKKHDVPSKAEMLENGIGNLNVGLSEELLGKAQQAYYGGRFECGYVGRVPGPIYQYDINSAYPWSITQLPCLRHGHWEFAYSVPTDGSLYLAEGEFYARHPDGNGVAYYGFPVRRKNGSIHFPKAGNGVYWSVEIAGAIHQHFDARKVWIYRTDCDCTPFDFIPEVYAARKRLGKSAKGMILKLALNSLYGKMAQSVGSAPYANPIWASLITAITRAKLGEVIHSNCSDTRCGHDVLMLATDGVFTTRPRLKLDISSELGAWDLDTHDGEIMLVQPGLYFFDNKTVKPKTRGLPETQVMAYKDSFYLAWEHIRTHHDLTIPVSIPIRSFIGMRLGVARRRPNKIGEWANDCKFIDCDEEGNHIHKDVTFDWTSKRRGDIASPVGFAMRTFPYEGSVYDPNFGYTKEIGLWYAALRGDLIDTDHGAVEQLAITFDGAE